MKPRIDLAAICLSLLAAVLALYAQTASHGFVSFDDPGYVVENPHVNSGLEPENLRWAFASSAHGGNWHPLTSLSHMLDVELFGLRAGPAHLESTLLHALNAMLLFAALAVLTGARWRAAAVAALFAVHPLHVESVAWISERKDVLSGAFFMLTLIAWARYTARPDAWRYGAVMLALGCGLLAKPMLVTLPFVLLLLDFWPLRRLGERSFWRLALEKAPLVGLSAACGLLTLRAQSGAGALLESAGAITPAWRGVQALHSYVGYLAHAFWPENLAFFYPHPALVAPESLVPLTLLAVAAAALLGALTLVAFLLRASRPYLLVGWLWYLGMLVPVIGLVQVGEQASADRYVYLPLIGIYLSVVWAAGDLVAGRPRARTFAAGVLLLALALLGWRSHAQIALWRDGQTLFAHAIAVTQRNYLAEASLGRALEDAGDAQGALLHYQRALELQPEFTTALQNIGGLFLDARDPVQAQRYFQRFIDAAPQDPEAHFHMALALEARGRQEDAIVSLARVLELAPGHAAARNNLGLLWLARGELVLARAQLEQAVRDGPSAETHSNLGLALWRSGELRAAVAQFEAALAFDPSHPSIRANLAAVQRELTTR